jgi:hypothetical protein
VVRAPRRVDPTPSVAEQARQLAASGQALDVVGLRRLVAICAGRPATAALVDTVREPPSVLVQQALGHTRRIVWRTFDLDEFLACAAWPVQVNDVALAVIAGALPLLPLEPRRRAVACGR